MNDLYECFDYSHVLVRIPFLCSVEQIRRHGLWADIREACRVARHGVFRGELACLRGTNTALLSISENGAFLLNLSLHPRTAHAIFPYSTQVRRDTQGTPGKPKITSYSAISAEIKFGCLPRACAGIPLQSHEFSTTRRICTRTPIWFIESHLLRPSAARSFRERTFRMERAWADGWRLQYMVKVRAATVAVLATTMVATAEMALNDSRPHAWHCCVRSKPN
jgi:hypothetical protein